jgi:demethylmenaquinone methyltransferase/2-methoxy-6-polyprenyl-1,4-benzoquinol methylase
MGSLLKRQSPKWEESIAIFRKGDFLLTSERRAHIITIKQLFNSLDRKVGGVNVSVQNKMISKFYDLLDVIYFNHDETSPRKAIVDLISDQETKVLEVCIGTATNSIIIAENRKNADVIGIDLSKEMLALAKDKIERKGIKNIKTLIMDATNMDFADNSFDVILISLVLHEVNDRIRDRIMVEAKRVLKSTGKIIIVEWDQPQKPIQKLLFSPIKAFEPKGFREFLQLNMSEYVAQFSLEVLQEKKCDFTRVLEISKGK